MKMKIRIPQIFFQMGRLWRHRWFLTSLTTHFMRIFVIGPLYRNKPIWLGNDFGLVLLIWRIAGFENPFIISPQQSTGEGRPTGGEHHGKPKQSKKMLFTVD